MTGIERKPVSLFKKWYSMQRSILPPGSIVVQSTTYHTWPYPALLYKKGTWAVIDLYFMLNDIPMTFLGELGNKTSVNSLSNTYLTHSLLKRWRSI
jgi:hypothetical protein